MTEQEIMEFIEANRDAKKVFINMPVDEQTKTLYDMVLFLRSQQASGQKEHVDFKDDIKYLKRELRGIGRRAADEKTLTTTEKIEFAIKKRSFWLEWFRDKVLPNLVTWFLIIVLTGILYTSFGGKLP